MVLCGLVLIATWYDTVHHHAWTDSLNVWVTQWIREPMILTTQGQHLYHVMLSSITWIGGNMAFLIAMGALSLYVIIKKEWTALFYILITAAVAIIVVHGFKMHVDSPRPIPFDMEHESFPSGHVSRSTLWCGLWLAMAACKQITLPRYAKKVLILIPLLVLYSRLALGRHWMSDVVGAYALINFVLLGASLTQARMFSTSSSRSHS